MELRARPSTSRRFAESVIRFRLPIVTLFFLALLILSNDLFWATKEWSPLVPLELKWFWDALSSQRVDLSSVLGQWILPMVLWGSWFLVRVIRLRRDSWLLIASSLLTLLFFYANWSAESIWGISLALSLIGTVALLSRPPSWPWLLFPLGIFFLLIPAVAGVLTLFIAEAGYRDLALLPLLPTSLLVGELAIAVRMTIPQMKLKPSGSALAVYYLEEVGQSLLLASLLSSIAVLCSFLLLDCIWPRFALILTLSFVLAILLFLLVIYPVFLSFLPLAKKQGK